MAAPACKDIWEMHCNCVPRRREHCFFFFLMFIYFEREGMSRGEAETVGDRECKAGSVLTADSLMRCSNS